MKTKKLFKKQNYQNNKIPEQHQYLKITTN